MPTMSITYNAGEGQRLAAVVGRMKGLVDEQGAPRSATAQECKQFVIETMRSMVYQQERSDAIQSISDTPFEPS